VAWSSHSIESGWVAEEADEGKERGVLIPVLLDSVSPPIGFRSIQTADLSGQKIDAGGERLERLLGNIKTIVARANANVDSDDERHSAIGAIESPQRRSGKYRKAHLWYGCAALTVILSSVFWYRSGNKAPSPVPVAAIKPAPIPSRSPYFCGSRKFVVNAKEILDAGLLIKRGSAIQAVARGEGIKFGLDLGPGYTPAGENRIARRPFPGVGLHEYALLAQVGADFYEVGVAANFTAKNDGKLRYQFNDSMLRDNQGSARVQLTVRCP
jgi:hypothetical protein